MPEGARRYDVFDYAVHNKTGFSGLENDVPDCYVNSLLQVCVLWGVCIVGCVYCGVCARVMCWVRTKGV